MKKKTIIRILMMTLYFFLSLTLSMLFTVMKVDYEGAVSLGAVSLAATIYLFIWIIIEK